ncbi:hypothetical protein D9756_004518 [Leucocoprinus leucothites]|uniref:Ubiquitin 3 binding protein But2 C-terminal domain-containing protein n=1 Tax=Leucocoprinus leucothites TaxID=201217 RepID=A0A8H5G9K6_9AGAR|nr:hypothetical protein D9756_004518 [Leucoagaricus leucothites]
MIVIPASYYDPCAIASDLERENLVNLVVREHGRSSGELDQYRAILRSSTPTLGSPTAMQYVTGEYVRLPSNVSDENLKQERSPSHVLSSYCFTLTPFLAYLCIAVTISSTLLSIVLYTSAAGLASEPTKPGPSTSELRRPSQYINLDKIKHTHDFPPIFNFPEIVLQVSLNDSRRTMREDYHMLHTNVGTIYTDDRHIYVTPEVSSVVQFRHLDYGMEKCSLNAIVPRYTAEGKDSGGSSVDVWLIDFPMEISRQIYNSWPSAPKRSRLLASFNFTSSSNSVYEFDCRSNEFTTLEFSCSSSINPCHLDFWQDKRRFPIGGVYVVQRAGSTLSDMYL